MIELLDVFVIEGGSANWIGSAATQATAFELAIKHGDGSYFVFSQQNGQKEFLRRKIGFYCPRRKSLSLFALFGIAKTKLNNRENPVVSAVRLQERHPFLQLQRNKFLTVLLHP